MIKTIKPTHKLIYLIDFILIIIISYFLYHGFAQANKQNRQFQASINNENIKIEEKTATDESETLASTSSLLNGVDVSHYQGDVQWQQVANAYQFAFIKATEGSNYTDPRFEENISNIASTSMKYGAYHFFNPDMDATQQARHFVSTIGSLNLSLPPVLDIEVEPSSSSRALRSAIKDWLAHVEKATGCRPIIYTNKYYWEKHLDNNFSDYPLWIGDYSTSDTALTSIPWNFWQYTDKGKVTGISGIVDKSRFDGSTTKLNQLSCS